MRAAQKCMCHSVQANSCIPNESVHIYAPCKIHMKRARLVVFVHVCAVKLWESWLLKDVTTTALSNLSHTLPHSLT